MVEGLEGIEVLINTATNTDQLLVFNLQNKLWLSLPKAVAHQLVPNQ